MNSTDVTKVHVAISVPPPDLASKRLNKQFLPSLWLRFVSSMEEKYFIAVDKDCRCGCGHKHQNIATAVACISEAGGYVVAVRRSQFHPLTAAEEIEFQQAISGYGRPSKSGAPSLALAIAEREA